jgi:EAL domain-containing protein (putative c-di-GMP-specific phosphodiesterase class I)
MRQAKRSGRDAVQSYSALRHHRISRQSALEASLPAATQNGELQLRFQPQLRISGELELLEALLSWKHPKLGLLSPGAFIPLAERNGFIVPIGQWVLREACRQLAEWRKAGHDSLKLAVNVSTVQLTRPGFPGLVASLLEEYELPPARLELELTESTLMKDEARSLRALRALRKLGVTVAIDDFGIGYSSLSYLSRLPADTVKIDQSFLRNTPSPDSVFPMISAIVTMVHSLGLQVVAEGVELPSEMEMLREAGCDCVQGYLLGRPMSPDAVGHMLKRPGPRW